MSKDDAIVSCVTLTGSEYVAMLAEIKRLRAALEAFACDCTEEELCKFPHACRNYVARAALEDK